MLYMAGAFTQFLSTGIFYVVILIFVIMGGKIYWQKMQIHSLTTDLRECRVEKVELEINSSKIEGKFNDCKVNLEALDRYNRRKPPQSVIKNNELDTTHLFMEPR